MSRFPAGALTGSEPTPAAKRNPIARSGPSLLADLGWTRTLEVYSAPDQRCVVEVTATPV
jgi:hypothetical protein